MASSNPDEPKFVIDINIIRENLEKVFTDDKREGVGEHEVCICRVPISLRSAKPEAFTPRFVGLGLYHHADNLIFTDKMKLGIGKRVLKHLLPNIREILNHCSEKLDSYAQIQSFYQIEDTTSYANDYSTLLYQLIVDSIFLLAFSRHAKRVFLVTLFDRTCLDETAQYPDPVDDPNLERDNYYILTGTNWRMPLVDSSGKELSMDGILRDIFMLENQIPVHVLKLISRAKVNSHIDFSKTLNNIGFSYSPLYFNVKMRVEEDDHHLLGHMYHGITNDWREFEPDPAPFILDTIFQVCVYALLLIWMLPWTFVYLVVLILQPILWFTRSIILQVSPWFGPVVSGQQKLKTLNPFYFVRSVIDLLHAFLASIIHSLPFPDRAKEKINSVISQVMPGWFLEKESTNSWDEGIVVIPSAMELHEVGIRFARKWLFRMISLYEERYTLYLPILTLNTISGVIIANLVAYESLTKSNCLVFTKYIELMRALIRTAEDVQLLKNANIIRTQLRDDDVVELLNGIPNTEIQKLETKIKKVIARLERIANLKSFLSEFIRAFITFSLIILFNPTLVQAIQQVCCSSIMAPSFQFCNKEHLIRGDDDYFLSSI